MRNRAAALQSGSMWSSLLQDALHVVLGGENGANDELCPSCFLFHLTFTSLSLSLSLCLSRSSRRNFPTLLSAGYALPAYQVCLDLEKKLSIPPPDLTPLAASKAPCIRAKGSLGGPKTGAAPHFRRQVPGWIDTNGNLYKQPRTHAV